jgi:hypothetical protein
MEPLVLVQELERDIHAWLMNAITAHNRNDPALIKEPRENAISSICNMYDKYMHKPRQKQKKRTDFESIFHGHQIHIG